MLSTQNESTYQACVFLAGGYIIQLLLNLQKFGKPNHYV